MKPKAQPCHRQDSQQDKDAQAARSRKKTWPTSASPRDGCTGLRPDAGQVKAPTKRPERPCRNSRPHTEAWCESSIEARPGGVSVNRLS